MERDNPWEYKRLFHLPRIGGLIIPPSVLLLCTGILKPLGPNCINADISKKVLLVLPEIR
jgi:hypothetical protein